jgi:cell wall-associated NlpC family hydrolase
LQPGDIVLFESGSTRWTGVYVGNKEVVWASSSAKKVIKASITESKVSDALYGARRLPDSAFSPGIAIAYRTVLLLGAPFRFGASGPTHFDSSGLTQFVHGQVGLDIPRTIAGQYAGGTKVTRSQLQPGDLIFFGKDSTAPSLVAVYMGSERFIFASSSEGKVVERTLSDSNYADHAVGARRYVESLPSTPPPPPPQPDLATQIIETAESFLGTPYVFGATGPNTFDCSGFTRYVFGQHDIYLPRTSYSQASAGEPVASLGSLRKGDLLIFVDTYKEGISHVGIYIADNVFIHAVPSTGVSYGSLDTKYWSTRLYSARRLF